MRILSYHHQQLDADADAAFRERFAANVQPDVTQGMAQLFTPEGDPYIFVTAAFAMAFCDSHPGYTWRPL